MIGMKALRVTDASTEIVVLAGRLASSSPDGQLLLHRAGYGRAETQGTYVLLVKVSSGEAHTDPFRWADWTMRAAHLALRDLGAIDPLVDGDTLAVEALRLALIEGRPIREQVEAAVSYGAHDHDEPPAPDGPPPCARCGEDGVVTVAGEVLCPDHAEADEVEA